MVAAVVVTSSSSIVFSLLGSTSVVLAGWQIIGHHCRGWQLAPPTIKDIIVDIIVMATQPPLPWDVLRSLSCYFKHPRI